MNLDLWDTSEMQKNGQPFWTTRVAEKMLNAIRAVGLISETRDGRISIGTPSLMQQALAMQPNAEVPPLEAFPFYVIDFTTA